MVGIDENESDPILVTSGVPQGSHLRSLLFILCINDKNKLESAQHEFLRYISCKMDRPM